MSEEVPTQYDAPPETRRVRYQLEQIDRCREYHYWEIEDALSARRLVENEWRECLRQYEGRPEHAIRDTPIPNAPNIEVPIGAIAADAIYAEAIDLIYQTAPVLTCRAIDSRYVAHAKAMQRFVNSRAESEWQLRKAVSHTVADDTQLGTGVYYIPWLEKVRKTITNQKLTTNAPRIRSLAPENFITPGSAPAWIEDSHWVAARFYMTPSELQVRAKYAGWDIDGVRAMAAGDMVRNTRDRYARTRRSGEEMRYLCEILEIYSYFDIDDDGIPEDLLITMDRASRKIIKVRPNPFDWRRPFETMVYQPRPHLFPGIGVMKMLMELGRSATDIHNARVLNMLLANHRVWVRKEGTANETEEIWPGKNILTPNPREDVVALQMADVYTSAIQAENTLMMYAERRTGVQDLGAGRGAALGSRTPGITALSAMQSVSKRFTPAFDDVRLATARAVQQCLFRYSERVLAGDGDVKQRIIRLLGPTDGPLLLDLLSQPDFDDGVSVELTASSATINRDADRQNAILLMQTLGQYYQQMLGLAQLALNPQAPPAMQELAIRISVAAGELVDRTIRTFDQVRDPDTFVLKIDDIMRHTQQQQQQQQALQALMNSGNVPGALGANQQPQRPGMNGATPPIFNAPANISGALQ